MRSCMSPGKRSRARRRFKKKEESLLPLEYFANKLASWLSIAFPYLIIENSFDFLLSLSAYHCNVAPGYLLPVTCSRLPATSYRLSAKYNKQNSKFFIGETSDRNCFCQMLGNTIEYFHLSCFARIQMRKFFFAKSLAISLRFSAKTIAEYRSVCVCCR